MPNQPYPIISVAGSSYELGYQHGEQARERVARSIDIYRTAFATRPGINWTEVQERARGFAELIETTAPDIMQEMKGIADGSGFNIEEIVAVNCRTEILYGQAPPTDDGAHECTTIAVNPAGSADNTTLLAKNWDWRSACQESVIILQARPDDSPNFVMIVEAGMVGRDGFNEHGIAVCGNLLRSTLDGHKPGVPVPLIRRKALNSTRLDDSMRAILSAERAASTNYIIAHESGTIVNFEASPDQVYPVYPESGLLTHSNHFTATAAQVQAIGCDVGPDSIYRIQRARDLLEAKIGNITVADVQDALRDHTGYPKSICRHDDEHEDPAQTSSSIASIVIDLGARVMYVASGPPCCHEYIEVGLPEDDATKGVADDAIYHAHATTD